MVNSISFGKISYQKVGAQKLSPSFCARLSQTGIEAADTFGYQRNVFLNGNLLKKQGIFERPAIAAELEKGTPFSQICIDYGCSNNPVSNATFIDNQILNKRSESILAKINKEELTQGLLRLYDYNYDNPELSLPSTTMLLELIKPLITPDSYIKNVGLLKTGAEY